MLERWGHEADQASDGVEAFQKIKTNSFDMVISDIKMPHMSGMELLHRLKEDDLPCPMVFITAFATIDSAVELMRLGAADYITKPFDEKRIKLAVERTLQLSKVLSENRELKIQLAHVAGSDEIIYQSPSMQQVMAVAGKVAKSESAVLITGESGTGKELLARYIHQHSPRQAKAFHAVNCAAISPSLVESELFGYEKGAFTGADRQTKGKFEFASGGTLFLDEIGDLHMEAQAKLLRTLQEKKVQRVGGNQEIPIDVRILCATNQNLPKMVEDGNFRRDLFFRINVVPIELPPLRARTADIVPLCMHFLKNKGMGKGFLITDGASRLLRGYNWPGNVRELANAMERVVILGPEDGNISVDTFSFLKRNRGSNGYVNDLKLPPHGISLDALEKDLVEQALMISGNNQTRAAELLGVTRARFRVLHKNAQNGNDI